MSEHQDQRAAQRADLLAQQGGECAICRQRHATAKGMCHVIEQNALLCRACSTLVNSFLNRAKVGVGIADLTRFLGRSATVAVVEPGPVILAVEPESTLEPEPTESTPDPATTLMIGGRLCEMAEGEWIPVGESE